MKRRRVHSRVEIVAKSDAQGRTHLTRLWAEGALGVRKTGDASVHLVGTAAGPIGADTIEIFIKVGDGAQLCVEGVAATIALPGTAPGVGRLIQQISIGDHGLLHLALPALIVTRDASVRTAVEIQACATAELVLLEQVSLGRFEEPGGEWLGRMTADRGDHPALRQSQSSDSILQALGHAAGTGSGALVTRLEMLAGESEPADIPTHGGAIDVLLAGGDRLMTSVGASLGQAHSDLSALLLLNRDSPVITTAD